MDGVQLSKLNVGAVRNVSTSIGTWLIAEGYAQLEMRREPAPGEVKQISVPRQRHSTHERRRR